MNAKLSRWEAIANSPQILDLDPLVPQKHLR